MTEPSPDMSIPRATLNASCDPSAMSCIAGNESSDKWNQSYWDIYTDDQIPVLERAIGGALLPVALVGSLLGAGCGGSSPSDGKTLDESDPYQTNWEGNCQLTIGGEELACEGDIDVDGVKNQDDECPLVQGGLATGCPETPAPSSEVENVNHPPVLAPIPNQNVQEGQPLSLIVSASDPDGQTVAISTGSLPRGASFNPTTSLFNWTPDFYQSGNYSVEIRATDGLLTVSQTMAISVGNVNRLPPELAPIGNKSINEGRSLSFDLPATDGDGDPITYSAVGLPSGATLETASGWFQWTPSYYQAGDYPVTFIASDGTLQDSEGSVITVNNVPTAVQVDAGYNDTCALIEGGSVLCWGTNDNGELTPPEGTFTQISMGYHHACGLLVGGGVECWGADYYGQSSPPAETFTQVSAGGDQTCGILVGGGVVCWGLNNCGQSTPPAGTFTQVSTGGRQTCGILVEGGVRYWGDYNEMVECWQNNDHGESYPPAGTFTQISAGIYHTCGILVEGGVRCWGTNRFGESTPPVGVFTQVSAGENHTCGILVGGGIECWGSNYDGESTPPAGTFTQISTGAHHTCGILVEGGVRCWGSNDHGQSNPPPF